MYFPLTMSSIGGVPDGASISGKWLKSNVGFRLLAYSIPASTPIVIPAPNNNMFIGVIMASRPL